MLDNNVGNGNVTPEQAREVRRHLDDVTAVTGRPVRLSVMVGILVDADQEAVGRGRRDARRARRPGAGRAGGVVHGSRGPRTAPGGTE